VLVALVGGELGPRLLPTGFPGWLTRLDWPVGTALLLDFRAVPGGSEVFLILFPLRKAPV
jgi:hypothetical protein